MGICSSSDSSYTVTAKLVLHDGRLEEYPYPVKVSYVLQKNPAVFICDSDEMEFDDVVSAISDDDELLPGQLYFALPLTQLKQRIPPEEMAALAVKASLALTRCSGEKTGRRREGSLRFSGENGESRQSVYGDGERRRSRSNGGGGRRRNRFTAKLNAIPE